MTRWLAVADHRIPRLGGDHRRVRPLGGGREVPRRRRWSRREQPVEADVEPRERRRRRRPMSAPASQASAASSSSSSAARSRIRRGSTSSDLGAAGRAGRGAPRPARRQPRQPRLHAVEDVAFGQPLPLLPAPRLLGDQIGCPPADLRRQRRTSRQPKISTSSRSCDERWSSHRERGQPVDLVAPQVDPDRARRRSTGTRRRSTRAQPPRPGARPGTRAGSRRATRRSTSAAGSSWSPGRTTTGSAVARRGRRQPLDERAGRGDHHLRQAFGVEGRGCRAARAHANADPWSRRWG